MPRRRASKGHSSASKGKKFGSIKRWNNRGDIPLDEVDQFHEQRDKILLEGDKDAPDIDNEDNEVFALEGLDESSDEEGEVKEADEDKEDDLEEDEAPRVRSKSKTKEKTAKKAGKKVTRSSEEESDEEEEESWGQKKSAYYSSNAAQLESDDEEAHEMEEQEARRLQAKLREPMREEDFGYGEALQNTFESKAIDDFWEPVKKPAVAMASSDKMSILRHLQKTSPETLALAQEWDDIAQSIIRIERRLSQKSASTNDKSLGLVHLHHQTQLTYAALLAFYLHLRASEKYAARPELLEQHPILKRLLTLKQSLYTLEDLSFNLLDSDDDFEFSSDDDDSYCAGATEEFDTWLATRKEGLDVGELEELLARAKVPSNNVGSKSKAKKKTKSKLEPPPPKKQKIESGQAHSKVTFDVEEPTLAKFAPSTAKKDTIADAYGEAIALDYADAADKNVRRKALRFHTAKIESASARRQGARNAMGGDDDVPYRERKKQGEKQKRTSLGAGGDDLDDAEPEPREQPRKRGRDEDSDGESSAEDDDDGYYSLVKKQKKDKKAQKKAEYDAMKETNRANFEDNTSHGQRSITRAILANKGLTPKRGKSVRNPRVKKRHKFEKAKKRLSSQKAVYKGGVGDTGHYGGEKTGISKVVKSMKL